MKKILVIDDEADIAELVKMRLENEGYQVSTLTSSRDAIEVIKQEKPDLILLDIKMPGKDGYQVCDEVKSDDQIKNIPVIVFTAKPQEKDLMKDVHSFYGAQDFVLKPIDHNELLSKISIHTKS